MEATSSSFEVIESFSLLSKDICVSSLKDSWLSLNIRKFSSFYLQPKIFFQISFFLNFKPLNSLIRTKYLILVKNSTRSRRVLLEILNLPVRKFKLFFGEITMSRSQSSLHSAISAPSNQLV